MKIQNINKAFVYISILHPLTLVFERDEKIEKILMQTCILSFIDCYLHFTNKHTVCLTTNTDHNYFYKTNDV